MSVVEIRRKKLWKKRTLQHFIKYFQFLLKLTKNVTEMAIGRHWQAVS